MIQKRKPVSSVEVVTFLKTSLIIAYKGIILGSIFAILFSVSSNVNIFYFFGLGIICAFLIALVEVFILQNKIEIKRYDKKLFLMSSKKEIFIVSFFFLLLISPMYSSEIMKLAVEHKEKIGYFQELAKSIFENKTDDVSKVKAILKWQEENMLTSSTYANSYQILFSNLNIIPKPPKICIRLSGQENPKWTLISKCGACEEDALAFMELAKLGNITVRSIHMDGEDHVFDEVLINGSWIIIDPTQGTRNGYNVSHDFFEKAWKLNISYAYAIYPNDTVEDVTYRYTNISNLTLKLIDSRNNSVENATVLVFSNNRYDHWFTNLTCITDSRGTCKFTLGDGNYTIEANKGSLFGDARVALKEGTNQKVTLNVKEDYLRNLGTIILTSQIVGMILYVFISYIIVIFIKLYFIL